MRRRFILLVALLLLVVVVVAAPASAGEDKPINGKMELTLVLEPCPVGGTGPFVTWVGTIVIDGVTYGWADFPTTPEPVFEKKFMYFEEYWTIFTLESGQAPTVALACNPGLVVLDGFNDGRGTPGGAASAEGTVASAADPGPFADVAEGSRMFWRGKVTNLKGAGDQFKATLHIH